jgi:hypothetical protein
VRAACSYSLQGSCRVTPIVWQLPSQPRKVYRRSQQQLVVANLSKEARLDLLFAQSAGLSPRKTRLQWTCSSLIALPVADEINRHALAVRERGALGRGSETRGTIPA